MLSPCKNLITSSWAMSLDADKSTPGWNLNLEIIFVKCCVSDTFTNVFRENFATRSSLALIWNSISSRLNAPPVRILLQTAPYQKLLASNKISLTGSAFIVLLLEQFILLYHHWTSVIDCGDKIIKGSMHPLDILSAFILSCSKYLWWETSCH